MTIGVDAFSQVEKKVTALADKVATLRQEKEALESTLGAKDAALRAENERIATELKAKSAEAEALKAQVADLSKERGEVKARVDGILARLDSIEL